MSKLAFPRYTRFDQVFANAVSSAGVNINQPNPDPAPFGPWIHSERMEHGERVPCRIGSFCSVEGQSLYVEPFAEVLDYVRGEMLAIDWAIFCWEIGRTGLVRCKYGSILGSRDIARIDPETIPQG